MKWMGWLVVLVVLAGCSNTPRTDIDYDVDYDFTKLKTFAWQQAPQEPATSTSLYTARVMDAAIEHLSFLKGFEQVSPEQADFLVTYHLIVDTKYRIDNYYNRWGYRGYWRGAGAGTSTVRQYKVGTLVIDMIDNQTKTVFWRGSASASVSRNLTPEQRDARIREAVNLVLAPFPS